MFSSIKSKVLAAVGAASLFASNAMAAAPSWWPASGADSTVFDDVLSSAAPIAIAVVGGVAGVRVVIKLINRGAGK